MKHPIVVGLQYGDEGKGKITDTLAGEADWVLRFNGGNNAGHTLWLNGKKVVTHSVPSGVMYDRAKNYIGSGCVVDPVALKKELGEIEEAGRKIDSERLKIDHRAHLIFPIHRDLDAAREKTPLGIGTTKRGIGPTYATKADRLGLRAAELFCEDAPLKLKTLCDIYNPFLRAAGLPESSIEDNLKVLSDAQAWMKPYVCMDVTPFYEVAQKQKCVMEGAQAVMLDLDHGRYPFVTSSNTLAAFASIGGPFPLKKLGLVIGVAKAYLTRVGRGPFPTELLNETGERIRANGGEYGATTGRPRRVGWTNLDELKTACRLTDCQGIVLTKADVLCGEKEVKLYRDGKEVSFPGWSTELVKGNALVPEAENFVKFIEDFVGVPVLAVGTGADRSGLFWRKRPSDFWSDAY